MKLYLDDYRKPPNGWTLATTADECIEVLKSGLVTELSLDHDLAGEKTGYEVVKWMVENNVFPPLIIIHTMNPVGRQRMFDTILRYAPEGTGVAALPGHSLRRPR